MNNNDLNTLDNFELSNLTPAMLHTAIEDNFKNYDLKTSQLIKHTDSLIELLSKLPSVDTFKFLKLIDKQFPGVSFHFIVECINFVYEGTDLCQQKLLFSFRASYYMVCFPDKEILQPMRTRLCKELLFSNISKDFFIDFQQKRQDVEKREFISKVDKKIIKKNLYIEYFKEFIYKNTELTSSELLNDDDE